MSLKFIECWGSFWPIAMTLILSCLTKNHAIQVSDRRITGLYGDLIDDYENKGIQYGALMAFAFSGPSHIGGLRTHIWIMNALAPIDSLDQSVNHIAERATEEFRKIPYSAPFRKMAIAGVGWSSNFDNSEIMPTYITISNALDEGRWTSVVKDHFEVAFFQFDEFTLLPPIGQTVPDAEFEQLRKNISRCVEHGTNPLEIIRLLGETIRSVAKYNQTVSQNLLAIVVPKASALDEEVFFATSIDPRANLPITGPSFFDIPAGTNQLTQLGPSIVLGNIVAERMTFTPHDPTISIYEHQIRAGIMPELNEASLIAYANVSPLSNEWAEYVKTLGFAIMEGPTSGFDLIQLIKGLKINSFTEINTILEDARTWGKDFLKSILTNSSSLDLSNQSAEPIHYVERIALIELLIRQSRRLPKL